VSAVRISRGASTALAAGVILSGVIALTAASCSAVGSPSAGAAEDTASLRKAVVQLEADARALARADGCSAANQCRTAPVGNRPCGGPRTYLAYCAATTDSVALFRKLDALKAAETKFNQASNMAGTCEFRMPPAVGLDGGSCKSQATGASP